MNKKNNTQLIYGFITGIIFGFLLQKGGVTKYDIILAQLRLTDFTVLKIMLSSVIVTMTGISILYPGKKINIHPKAGSIKNSVIGGLIFGVGFAVLGYCPGTIAGAVGNGYLDGLIGGMAGIIIGSGIFASMYPVLVRKKIITEDKYSKFSYFDKIKGPYLFYTVPFSIMLAILMFVLEKQGL